MIFFGTEILSNILHLISSTLLIPVIVALLCFIIYAILCLGGFITEKFSRNTPTISETEQLIRNISQSTSPEKIHQHIAESILSENFKKVLKTITNNHDIGPEAREALADKLIEEEELKYTKKTTKTDILLKLGPTLGLMGTLIPLGPGLGALGTGDITTLSQALLIAFDTTVTGLTAATIGYLISRYRKQWYNDDLSLLDSLTTTLLETLK